MNYVEEYLKKELENLEGNLAHVSDAIYKRLNTEQNAADLREMAELENRMRELSENFTSIDDPNITKEAIDTLETKEALEKSIAAFNNDIDNLEEELASTPEDERYQIQRELNYLIKQRDLNLADLRDTNIYISQNNLAVSREIPKIRAKFDKIKTRYETNNELLGVTEDEVHIQNELTKVKEIASNEEFKEFLRTYSNNLTSEASILDRVLSGTSDEAQIKKIERRKNEVLQTIEDISLTLNKLETLSNVEDDKIDYDTYLALTDAYVACENLTTARDKQVLNVNVNYDAEKDIYLVKASYDNLSNTKEFTPDEFENEKNLDKYINRFVDKVALSRGKSRDLLLDSYCNLTIGDLVLSDVAKVSEIKGDIKNRTIDKKIDDSMKELDKTVEQIVKENHEKAQKNIEELDKENDEDIELPKVLDEEENLVDKEETSEEIIVPEEPTVDETLEDNLEDTASGPEVLDDEQTVLEENLTDEEIAALEDKIEEEALGEEDPFKEFHEHYIVELNNMFNNYTEGDPEKTQFIINNDAIKECDETFKANKEILRKELEEDSDKINTPEFRQRIVELYEQYISDMEELVEQIVASEEYLERFSEEETLEENPEQEELENNEDVQTEEEVNETANEAPVREDAVVKQVLTRVVTKRVAGETILSAACLAGGAVMMGMSASLVPAGGLAMAGGIGTFAHTNLRAVKYLATNHVMNKIARAFSTKEREIYYKVGAPTAGKCGFFDAKTNEQLTSRELGELRCEKFGLGYLSYRGKTVQEILDAKFKNDERLNDTTTLTDDDFDHLGCCTKMSALRKVIIDDLAASFQSFGGVVGGRLQDYFGYNNGNLNIDEIAQDNYVEGINEVTANENNGNAEDEHEETIEQEENHTDEDVIEQEGDQPEEILEQNTNSDVAENTEEVLPTPEIVLPAPEIQFPDIEELTPAPEAILPTPEIVLPAPEINLPDSEQVLNEIFPVDLSQIETTEVNFDDIKMDQNVDAFNMQAEPIEMGTSEEIVTSEPVVEPSSLQENHTEETIETLETSEEPRIEENNENIVVSEDETSHELDIVPGLFEQSEISPEVFQFFKELLNDEETLDETPTMGKK